MSKRKPSDSVRVGIIGVGIGQAHIAGYKKVPQAEIAALCDTNVERAQAVARENGLENVPVFADHRAMLEETELDGVSVGVPNALHRPIAVDCLNAGKHVICEKPLAVNAREAQKIADAAAKNKRHCMVAQVNRFRSDSRFLKEVIAAGKLGKIYYAHAGALRRRGIPGYGGWFTTKAQSGGGPLIDIGVHLLDIAWWLCGCPQPIAASGVTYAEFGPRRKGSWGTDEPTGTFDVEDLAVGLIRFANGLTINLEASWALNAEADRQWCHIHGSEAGCNWGQSPGIYSDLNGVPTVTNLALPHGDAWQGEMQHFIDCILNDRTPDPDATQGVTMMKMLDAIYKSSETGREVIIK
ncbi:MAG TPA: Gfo/Idh/MocA family oxidoreductase [Abditibacteriaceae bacterium]|nr:Gfo/Idh/MocA family oxidoreductase [Abditibacteriaceae bacterium]